MGSESENESKSNNINNNENGLQIPPGTKKMIQCLRGIVNNNCTDNEIYSVLRDCHMDPNDAVHRLLSQDIFHQVKSKRERRKEMKETQESMTWCSNDGYRGVKAGAEYNDICKAAYMKEDLPTAPSVTSSSLTYHMRTMNEQPSPHSKFFGGDSFSADNGMQFVGTGIPIFSSERTTKGPQTAWVGGTSGHISMADIVKLGQPQTRSLHMTTEISYTLQNREAQESLLCSLKLSDDFYPSSLKMHRDIQCPDPANVSKTNHRSGTTASQHDFDDEWPVIEQRTVESALPILNVSTTPGMGMLPRQSQLFGDGNQLPKNCLSDDTEVSERNVANKNLVLDSVQSNSPSSRLENPNYVEDASYCNDVSFNDMISYNLLRCMNELHEGREHSSHLPPANVSSSLNDEVTSTAVSLQQLSLGKEETQTVSLPAQNSAVVFPSDMPALAADCSHLNFGTYKSGAHASIPGLLVSNPLKSDTEKASAMLSGPSSVCLETRNSGYIVGPLGSKQVGSMCDTHWLTSRNHDLPVSSQPESIKQNIHEVNGGHDHISPKSVLDSCFKNIQQPSSPWSVMINPHARNLPPLHRELQASSMPVSVDVLASAVQSARDSDRVYSSLSGTQSLTSRYSDIVSSAGSSTIPMMAEILNSDAFSLPNSHSSILPAASLDAGHVLPQHQSAHSYSQPIPSFEELISWTGCSAVHQTYPHSPSALQRYHAYQDCSIFHDLAGIKYNLQQSRGGVASRTSLPMSNADISSHGGFGNPANFSGSFLNDLSTIANGSTVGYYDFLQAQYREGNNFAVLPQNGSFSSWDHGHGSGALSTIPDNGYYHFQEQGQPLSTYQQG